MKIHKIFFVFLYIQINYLFVQNIYSLQAKKISKSIGYETEEMIIPALEKHFPAVITQVIAVYLDIGSFFYLLKKYEKGICYSHCNNLKNKKIGKEDFQFTHNIDDKVYRCVYDTAKGLLKLLCDDNGKILAKHIDDNFMHKNFKKLRSIRFAMPNNGNIIIIIFDSFLGNPYNGDTCLIFPSDKNQKEYWFNSQQAQCIKNIWGLQFKFLLQGAHNNEIILVHSPSTTYNFYYNKYNMLTRLLFYEDKKPDIKSYYLPGDSQCFYKVEECKKEENIIFIFSKHKNGSTRFYMIFIGKEKDDAIVCAEFPCNYIPPAEIKDHLMIAMNNVSHKNCTDQDYFMKNNKKHESVQCVIHTLELCRQDLFLCFTK